MNEHIGKQSIRFGAPPNIIGYGSIAGLKEGEGPLGRYFDQIVEDVLFGEETWEKAESKFQKEAVKRALKNANVSKDDIDYLFAGDLLGQLIATSFGIKEFGIPFYGLFGACSTMAESLQLASMAIAGGFATNVVAMTSSHYCGAEKQFRFPLEYGNQRPLSASWTVTGSGATVLSSNPGVAKITGITTGKIIDYGLKDSLNMGACMAPSAANTILQHFEDFGVGPDEYDLIITGDLGYYGRDLVVELASKAGVQLKENFKDCGIEIFDQDEQDTHAGGSGCGCAAITLNGYIIKELMAKNLKKVLFVPTGALMSTVSYNEGQSVPGIAHAVIIEAC